MTVAAGATNPGLPQKRIIVHIPRVRARRIPTYALAKIQICLRIHFATIGTFPVPGAVPNSFAIRGGTFRMNAQTVSLFSQVGFVLAVFLAGSGQANAQWARIGGGNGNAGSAPGNGPASAGTCVLLTDGSVMCHEVADPLPAGSVDGTHWWRLTPDINGKYETGNWSQLTSSPATYGPLFYCSAVLPDGRVAIIGGEYNLIAKKGSPAAETTLGYVFDPTQNSGSGSWAPIGLGTTGWSQIGDSNCVVQPDKTFILGDLGSKQIASLDLATLTLSLVNSPKLENSKADNNSEEGWTLLPDGTILTVDTSNNSGTGSEIYSPSSQTWATTGSTPFTLVSNTGNSGIVPEM